MIIDKFPHVLGCDLAGEVAETRGGGGRVEGRGQGDGGLLTAVRGVHRLRGGPGPALRSRGQHRDNYQWRLCPVRQRTGPQRGGNPRRDGLRRGGGHTSCIQDGVALPDNPVRDAAGRGRAHHGGGERGGKRGD